MISGQEANPRIPKATLEKLWLWVGRAYDPGSFLAAVLRNDLVNAVCLADDENAAALKDIVLYVYNVLPGSCWGTPAKVDAWRAKHSNVNPLMAGILKLHKMTGEL
jgi:hypothetical protein